MSRTAADGSVVKAWNLRTAWQTEGFVFHYATNTARIELQKSNTDAATAAAVTDAAVRAALKP